MIEATKSFPLATPVPHGGETISEVVLRRPKGREIRKMRNRASGTAGIAGDLTTEMMATLADREEDLFDEMDAADYRKVEAWLETLLGN